MRSTQLAILFAATVLAFSAIHAPQPLLPTLQEAFGVSGTHASLVITAVLVPLAVAPVAYGLVLQKVSARHLLIIASALLAVTHLVIAWSPSLNVMLGLRGIQGLLIPAILTALMSYLATLSGPSRMDRVMAGYVGATVIGGLLGRLFAGAISSLAGWEMAFLLMGVAQLLGTVALLGLAADPPASFRRLRWRAITDVLRQPQALRIYGAIACLFGAFMALLTFLPFRLVALGDGISDSGIALMYTGYLMGAVTAVGAVRIDRQVGGTVRTMLLGVGILGASLLAFLIPWVAALFLVMFVSCAGMFLVHALAPGFLNQQVSGDTGVINGLYIACYYAGGALGSWLPGYVYHGAGWTAYLLVLVALTGLAGYWIARIPALQRSLGPRSA